MRLGSLLVEAKLTESDFQTCECSVAEEYRDFDTVFDRELLPRVGLPPKRRKQNAEFPENYSQEFESLVVPPETDLRRVKPEVGGVIADSQSQEIRARESGTLGYASYQLIRNVLAACAERCSFCVMHDERRPDLREEWFQVMRAVKEAELRTRLKVITWQELAAFLPSELQTFLDVKYGIVPPVSSSSPLREDIGGE